MKSIVSNIKILKQKINEESRKYENMREKISSRRFEKFEYYNVEKT